MFKKVVSKAIKSAKSGCKNFYIYKPTPPPTANSNRQGTKKPRFILIILTEATNGFRKCLHLKGCVVFVRCVGRMYLPPTILSIICSSTKLYHSYQYSVSFDSAPTRQAWVGFKEEHSLGVSIACSNLQKHSAGNSSDWCDRASFSGLFQDMMFSISNISFA